MNKTNKQTNKQIDEYVRSSYPQAFPQVSLKAFPLVTIALGRPPRGSLPGAPTQVNPPDTHAFPFDCPSRDFFLCRGREYQSLQFVLQLFDDSSIRSLVSSSQGVHHNS